MNDNWIPIVAIVFSLSIPIIAIIVEYFNRKVKMKVIEKAIEKGVTLEGLSLEEEKKPRIPYRSGMIVTASGLGIAVFALFLGKIEADAFYPIIGMAFIPLLIGIALIINDKMNYDRYFNQDTDSP
jgi:undecaprenyl pyrophosphate phosphatase UppP